MGLTFETLKVKPSREARRSANVKFLIDSGAVYSLVPINKLKRLGIKPYRELEFTLADGRTVRRRVGDAYFEYRGNGGAAPVIFGRPGDEPLLGATTLGGLGFVLDPFQRKLHPMTLLLKRANGNS
jgi:predicted aspartyl protease